VAVVREVHKPITQVAMLVQILCFQQLLLLVAVKVFLVAQAVLEDLVGQVAMVHL
jgi:hypothetical protein